MGIKDQEAQFEQKRISYWALYRRRSTLSLWLSARVVTSPFAALKAGVFLKRYPVIDGR
jgi:hypothetical protein